jgi:hypothetical protein
MWALLLRFWKPLAAVALVIGAALILHHRGYESGYAAAEARWQGRFAAAERAREAADEKAHRKEADSSLLTQKVDAEHEKAVASLTSRAIAADQRIRDLSVRLAAASARRGEVCPAPGASGKPDSATASVERAQRAGASISDVGRRCELDALSLAALQRWVTEQRAIINR